MFSFVISFTVIVIGLILRLGATIVLMALKVAFVLGKSLFKVLAFTCQGIGCVAAKGYKALQAARARRSALIHTCEQHVANGDNGITAA